MIYYRMSSRGSRNKPPKFAEDKFRVARICIKTFGKAFADTKEKVHFILDRCSGEYLDLIKEFCPLDHTHEFTDYGHYNSALKQYNLAQETKDEVIVFVEDDYLWKEGVGKYLLEAVKELGIASPYDNPDFYKNEPFRSRQERIRVINNWHWRTTVSTTMTFAILKHKFILYRKSFDDWGPSDSPLWNEIGDTIWCPIPSFATHFVQGKLAPSVDWTKYY